MTKKNLFQIDRKKIHNNDFSRHTDIQNNNNDKKFK